MSGPRCVHLLCADEALRQGYRRSGAHIAVCGELVDASNLPSPSCPDECDCEIAYCPACLRAATECNATARQSRADASLSRQPNGYND